MAKFDKFLEENNNSANRQIRQKTIKEEDKNGSYSSLKIKVDTLDTLRKLKMVTNETSYSSLIYKMIDVYIEQLPKEEQNNINMLR